MSIEPVDELLDGVAGSDVWAAAVEDHLDGCPFAPDPDEVDRLAARVEGRIRRSRRRGQVWVVLGIAAVLAAVIGSRWIPAHPIQGGETPGGMAAPAILLGPVEVVTGPLIERPGLELGPDAEVLRSERGPTTVLLVREGEVRTPTRAVFPGHWVLSTEADGVLEQVVFPDGQVPPALNADVWPESVQGQLRSVRWSALPSETLSTLDTLLEAP